MNGNCGECERRWYCDIDPAECSESDGREKLIELIEKARKAMKKEQFSCDLARNSFIAEYLIANGVTVKGGED